MSKLSKLQSWVANNKISSDDRLGYFTIPNGESRVRVLPGSPTDPEDFFLDYGQHWHNGKYHTCLHYTNGAGDDCPLCNAGINLIKRVLVRLIDRDDEDKGAQRCTLPVSVFRGMAGILQDASEYGNVLDPVAGRDFIIKRTGKEKMTRYEVRPGGSVQPILGDADAATELLASLGPIEKEAYIPDHKQLVAAVEGTDYEPEGGDDEEYDSSGYETAEDSSDDDDYEPPSAPPARADNLREKLRQRMQS